MPTEPWIPDPLETAQMVIDDHGWPFDMDGEAVYAEVKPRVKGDTPYDITVTHSIGREEILTIRCDYRLDRERPADEPTNDLIRYLVTEFNEGLPFGSFSYRPENKLLGFCHGLIVRAVPEHVLAFQIESTIAQGMFHCAAAFPLFDRVLKTATLPPKELIELFKCPQEGEA